MLTLQFIILQVIVFSAVVYFLKKILSGDTESAVKRLGIVYEDLVKKQKDLTEKLEAAEKELKACANYENVSAEYHYQLGRLQEAQGFYDAAVENYKKALELSPSHQRAIFHLAYRCDLAGESVLSLGKRALCKTLSPKR